MPRSSCGAGRRHPAAQFRDAAEQYPVTRLIEERLEVEVFGVFVDGVVESDFVVAVGIVVFGFVAVIAAEAPVGAEPLPALAKRPGNVPAAAVARQVPVVDLQLQQAQGRGENAAVGAVEVAARDRPVAVRMLVVD